MIPIQYKTVQLKQRHTDQRFGTDFRFLQTFDLLSLILDDKINVRWYFKRSLGVANVAYLALLRAVSVYSPENDQNEYSVSGCGGPACSPAAVCVPSQTLIKDSPSCPPAQQWCPFQGSCLTLAQPCHPSLCTNCTRGHHLPPGTSRPQYTLKNDIVFALPPGPARALVRGGVFCHQDQFVFLLSTTLLSGFCS